MLISVREQTDTGPVATYYSTMHSPMGSLLMVGDGEALCGLYMEYQKYAPHQRPDWQRNDAAFNEVRRQLNAYFAGELRQFDLPLRLIGTEFQKQVWNALLQIPYGYTATYGELARDLGQPNAFRAVGLANGRNPIGIIVPCHRVIGADGSLTGYGGGIERKRWLLALEGGGINGDLFGAA